MNERIVELLHKIMNQATLSDGEKKELNSWMKQSRHNRILYNEIMNSEKFRQDVKKMLGYDSNAPWKKINRHIHSRLQRNNSIFRDRSLPYVAAATSLIIISTIACFMFINPVHDKQPATNDLAPGTEKAVLILADGTSIALDNTTNGEIARQGNTIVLKEDGLLAYNPDNDKPRAETVYNTIKTVKGQYFSSLVLTDGSKIWLNAVSSIRFPASFIEEQRDVEITGEAYFEVAKDASRPFRVFLAPSPSERAGVMPPSPLCGEGRGEVEVLGTHFNINAYNDEAFIKTTLLKGTLKITVNGKFSFLRPGQQALFSIGGDKEGVSPRGGAKEGVNASEIKIVNDADLEEAVAWKNRVFRFRDADIQSIMRQVEKWYDAEVVYEGNITRKFFVEDIPRSVPVSELLTFLEKTGCVQFKMEGNPPAGRAGKITVMPVNKQKHIES